mmetsp:Transcript_3949/g.5147  ORF Transcript_3949/g.5147 Transcript_3949/m.5147 type:complete len:215 (-) Transcript_3949:273-917(-)
MFKDSDNWDQQLKQLKLIVKQLFFLLKEFLFFKHKKNNGSGGDLGVQKKHSMLHFLWLLKFQKSKRQSTLKNQLLWDKDKNYKIFGLPFLLENNQSQMAKGSKSVSLFDSLKDLLRAALSQSKRYINLAKEIYIQTMFTCWMESTMFIFGLVLGLLLLMFLLLWELLRSMLARHLMVVFKVPLSLKLRLEKKLRNFAVCFTLGIKQKDRRKENL